MAGYAVIDIETTGLAAEGADRIIEIGIVHVDAAGLAEAEYETLVNPGRDLGPVHIHGIRGADVAEAPGFGQVADRLLDLLADRVLVAHNATFEARFLRAEFARLGVTMPITGADAVCTMRLATRFLPGAGRSLADCCAAFDIELSAAHEAIADARATATLLAAYLGIAPDDQYWCGQQRAGTSRLWPRSGIPSVPWLPRSRSSETGRPATERDFLERATALLPPAVGGAGSLEYLALVDEALADGLLSVDETDGLLAAATRMSIGTAARRSLHAQYFRDLVAAVWADGVLTDAEAERISAVGIMLGIPAAVIADGLVPPAPRPRRRLVPPVVVVPPTGLAPGSLVVLTGQMRHPRSVYEAELVLRGHRVHPAVTRDVDLVVAADVDSLSGKARKARQYGIPIASANWLDALLGI
ncbi:MAG: exonuclease domain-containing protein [Microbacteriaceae bacterium]